MINIQGKHEINDPFYRYKMPRVNIKIQKTFSLITNIGDICNSLNREVKHVLMYIQHKIGTRLALDKSGFVKINKDANIQSIQGAIYEYIQVFVLCPTCENPETQIISDGKKTILSCKACSYCDEIKPINKIVGKMLEKT